MLGIFPTEELLSPQKELRPVGLVSVQCASVLYYFECYKDLTQAFSKPDASSNTHNILIRRK
jgi:hypothetical protein